MSDRIYVGQTEKGKKKTKKTKKEEEEQEKEEEEEEAALRTTKTWFDYCECLIYIILS